MRPVPRANATLRAPGGAIALRASADPDASVVSGQGSIKIERGAQLDVAGSQVEGVSVSRNVASIELRGNELADSPEQRAGKEPCPR